MGSTLTDQFEDDAQALAMVWLAHHASVESCKAKSDRIVAIAAARAEQRTGWLALAFEALKVALDYPATLHPEQLERIGALREAVQRSGCRRAIELIEAADATLTITLPHGRPDPIAALLRHTPQRPPAEHGWTERSLSVLYASAGNFDAGLKHGLRAQAEARRAGVPLLSAAAGNALGFVFLSVGDIEGALTVLPEATAQMRRFGGPAAGAVYNLLLAQVLAHAWDQAQASLPEVQNMLHAKSRLAAGLRYLAARVHAQAGRHAEAVALVAALPRQSHETSPIAANRVWLAADVYLACGAASKARALIEEFLRSPQAAAPSLSPMNGTQLYRALSTACEATGDHRQALDALRRSQAHCFSWVGASLRARLQALAQEADPVAHSLDPERHERRLGAIDRAVADAQSHNQAVTGDGGVGRQSRILADVTHEMRTPINGLIGMTSLLMLSNLDERQRRYISLAHSSAQMLMSLCNDVLDLAKLEVGKLELKLQPTDLSALVRETAELFAEGLLHSGVTLQVEVTPALPPRLICADLRIKQVLMNLLSNAAKFTREGSITVAVAWTPKDAANGVLHVSVDDTGPGFDEAARARLFQEFVQANADVAARYGGSGLGLSLCRSLLTRMGGRIDARSTPGKGSRFWFELPLRVAESDQPYTRLAAA